MSASGGRATTAEARGSGGPTGQTWKSSALVSSELRYRRLFETAKDGILILDAETGMVEDVNPYLADLLGFTKEQLLRKRVWELGSFRNIIASHDKFTELQLNEYVRYDDLPLETATGMRVDVEFVSNVYLVNGAKMIQCNVRNITGRKQTENALKLSEDRFRAIFEQAGIGIALVSIANGRILKSNQALADMLGYTRDELGRLRVEDISQSDDYSDDRDQWESMVAGNTARYQMDKRYRRKDGGEIWGLLTCSAVRDSTGHPTFLIGMLEDITERKQARAQLRSSEKRMRAVFEQAGVGIVQVEAATGRFVQANQRFCEIAGRSREELEGLTFAAITHPKDVSGDLEIAGRLRAGTVRECTREKRYLRPDGSEVWVAVTVSAMWQPGEVPDYFIAVVQDIAERKRLEDQVWHAQKMEAVGTLAAGIAHDFNNILAAVSGYAELSLLTLVDNPEVRNHLGGILRAASRATDLVRQILTFSRQHPQDRQPIRLQPIVEECTALLRSTVPATIEFATSLAPDTPVVLADATQVHQVLMNLGTNSWHAMKDGPGRLEIELAKCDVDESLVAIQPLLHPGVYACLSVSDTGCGMDAETLRRIFEPFFTTKPVGEGTGLGLAVVHGIMVSHEGAVTVYSQPGEGTVFHLYFPAYAGGATVAVSGGGPTPRGHGERILLVDDEEWLVRIGQETLTALGYEVEVSTRPEEALAMVRADPLRFSLVITDQTMPRMSGLVLAVQLRLIRPGLPVILTSGYSLPLTHERLEAAGIQRLLVKPSTIHALATAVHAAI